jgi:release factor glutamine methyltransferase
VNVIGELRAAGCAFAEREAELLEVAASGPDLEALVRRRCAGEPLEHLLGWVEFRGRRLSVGPDVFVPRRRTELLSELADGPGVLVELCCGVGPIAATAAAAKTYAADIDRTAAEYAARNAPEATVLVGDLFAPLPGALRGAVDVIAANAPYVPTAAIATMPPEARDNEPHRALDGGPDGLTLHRRIAMDAPRWLRPGGRVLIETGRLQVTYTVAALRAVGLLTHIEIDDARQATVAVGVMP